MTGKAVRQARWFDHVNAVNPSPTMRKWLTDRISLTVKLIAHSRQFRVRRLRQSRARSLPDEYAQVGLARALHVQEREVLLLCDEVPVVYAHTIVPLTATATDWPFFGRLGERSLGTTLFGDPRVRRGTLQYARLQPQHPLVLRAAAAVGATLAEPVFARRCIYQRKRGLLLVTELFLPTLSQIESRSHFQA